MIDANEILFRCSSLGYLMTEPQEKSPAEKYFEAYNKLKTYREQYQAMNPATKTAVKKLASIEKQDQISKKYFHLKDKPFLGKTVQTHLIDVYTSSKYERFTEIHGKQLEKGNDTEENSITTVSLITNLMFRKNEDHLRNEYIMGTPDLFTGESILNAETVRDTKSSWDVFTFNRSKFKELDEKYYWQLTGYAALTGAKKLYVDFCLNNTPLHLIQWELYQQEKKQPDSKLPLWAKLQIIANHVYDLETFEEYVNNLDCRPNDENSTAVYRGFVPISLAERHHVIEFERNDDDIERLYQRVRDCREWMNEHLFKLQLAAA